MKSLLTKLVVIDSLRIDRSATVAVADWIRNAEQQVMTLALQSHGALLQKSFFRVGAIGSVSTPSGSEVDHDETLV